MLSEESKSKSGYENVQNCEIGKAGLGAHQRLFSEMRGGVVRDRVRTVENAVIAASRHDLSISRSYSFFSDR